MRRSGSRRTSLTVCITANWGAKASSRRRETQFSRAETKVPKTVPAIQSADCRDKMRAQIAANSGRFALNWEISVSGLRGGAGRTRTSNQTIISSWLAKCPKWRGCLCEHFVSATGRLSFYEMVSAASSLPTKIPFPRTETTAHHRVLPPGSSNRAKVAAPRPIAKNGQY